jgi:hypothetical protein
VRVVTAGTARRSAAPAHPAGSTRTARP